MSKVTATARKQRLETISKVAFLMGAIAFKTGEARNAYNNKDLRKYMTDNNFTWDDEILAMKSFFRGWDTANVSAN